MPKVHSATSTLNSRYAPYSQPASSGPSGFNAAMSNAAAGASGGARTGSNGTYGTKTKEQDRLGIQRGSGLYEAEHSVAYNSANPDVRRATKEGHQLEGQMPAYYETKPLHRAHAGTGRGALLPERTGWSTSESYRSDQRAALRDSVARAEGVSMSNATQLGQLGYGHQTSYAAQQNSGGVRPAADPTASDSFSHMVRQDPGLTHSLTGRPVTDHLGPQGQAEAQASYEAARTGEWPSRARQNELLQQFGAI